jgi:hypothetical protein
MNTYYFTLECVAADFKSMTKIFKIIGTVTKTEKICGSLNWEFPETIYQLTTDLSLDTVKELVEASNKDLHYVYRSIDVASNWEWREKPTKKN